MKLNGLEKYFETVNAEIVDFKQVNKFGSTPLMYAFIYNKSQNLNLSSEQFNYIIKKSNLRQITKYGRSTLMIFLLFNKSANINLGSEKLDYLIKNSDLKQVDDHSRSPLMFALRNHNEQNLDLSSEQWKYLIENSNLSIIKEEADLIELKKIRSELLNKEILVKISITEETKKNNKI